MVQCAHHWVRTPVIASDTIATLIKTLNSILIQVCESVVSRLKFVFSKTIHKLMSFEDPIFEDICSDVIRVPKS